MTDDAIAEQSIRELSREVEGLTAELKSERAQFETAARTVRALEAEVARLREERGTALRDWRFVIDEAAKNRDEALDRFNALEAVALQSARDLATERAAHEATKSDRDSWKGRTVHWQHMCETDLKAAEQRVTELEREMHKAHVQTEQVLRWRDAFADDLSSARGLLERWKARKWGVSLDNDTAEFLIRHPATPPPPPPPRRGAEPDVVCCQDGCEKAALDGSDYCGEHQG